MSSNRALTGASSLRQAHRAALALTVVAFAVTASLIGPRSTHGVAFVKPTASFTATPSTQVVGEEVVFDGSGSDNDDPDGAGSLEGAPITTWEWDLDGNSSTGTDGFEVTESDAQTTTSYAGPGNVDVRLRVTDDEGDVSDPVTQTVRVHRRPVADFIFAPSVPDINEQVLFSSESSDPDGSDVTSEWDFENDGAIDATGDTATHAYTTPGEREVRLRVTDADGGVSVVTQTVTVPGSGPSPPEAPFASFTWSPQAPLSGKAVTFDASASTPPSGESITDLSWELDGDGDFDDASGPIARWTYARPGRLAVSVRATASGGGVGTETRQITIGNRAPEASFRVSPRFPTKNEEVELISTSDDPDGPIASQSWDLDGDGEFDDGTKRVVTHSFPKGETEVALQVIDEDGAGDTAVETITVGRRNLDLLSPFPVVRLAGKLLRSGATKIKKLSVRAPKGADVEVQCKGKSCPFKHDDRNAKSARVKFPNIERVLQPGVVIKVLVSDRGNIGKFTRFKLRDGKAPKRVDRCLGPKRPKPIPCPSR